MKQAKYIKLRNPVITRLPMLAEVGASFGLKDTLSEAKQQETGWEQFHWQMNPRWWTDEFPCTFGYIVGNMLGTTMLQAWRISTSQFHKVNKAFNATSRTRFTRNHIARSINKWFPRNCLRAIRALERANARLQQSTRDSVQQQIHRSQMKPTMVLAT